MKRNLLLLAVSMLVLSCTHAHKATPAAAPQAITTDEGLLTYIDFSAVAAKTIDGVVHIRTEQTRLTPMYQSFFGFIINQGVQKQTYSAYGSGVIVSNDGYIVTNNHVVQDAERINVTLNDKRVLPAKIIGTDPSTDLAVIKVETQDLCAIDFGNSDQARVGQPVLAIGNPFNLTSTVTAGIISAKARNMGIIENTRGAETPLESFIQTDAAVNPGNSGGALVDGNGRLIGIVTAIASGDGYYTGYSFAIPANIAQKVSKDLIDYGYVQRAYLGVNVREVSSDYAEQMGLKDVRGLHIVQAMKECAAYEAGIREGDILLAVDGQPVNSFAEMMEELGKFSPGDNVEVTYLRNGHQYKAVPKLLNHKGNTERIWKK